VGGWRALRAAGPGGCGVGAVQQQHCRSARDIPSTTSMYAPRRHGQAVWRGQWHPMAHGRGAFTRTDRTASNPSGGSALEEYPSPGARRAPEGRAKKSVLPRTQDVIRTDTGSGPAAWPWAAGNPARSLAAWHLGGPVSLPPARAVLSGPVAAPFYFYVETHVFQLPDYISVTNDELWRWLLHVLLRIKSRCRR
jgi:hypothetical protein